MIDGSLDMLKRLIRLVQLDTENKQLQEENKQLKEAVLVQKEYIELLIEELNETIPIAHSHGWETTRFEKGKQLRSKILKLTMESEE